MPNALEPLTLPALQHAVAGSAAAFRCRRRLEPAGGPGDKVFPPTFAGAVYAVEQRRLPGRAEPVTCVLLDTVQSQANRMELALQEAVDNRKLRMPLVVVDFSQWSPTGDVEADKAANRLIEAVGKITSLQLPHRLADAILRDSQIEEETNGEKKEMPFRESSKGKALNTASPQNATPLYQLCPTALVFGMWDSTGPKGGLGAKFERAVVSEIIGVGAEVGDLLRGVRRDPLEIRSAVKVLKAADGNWSIAPAGSKNAVAPSEINHSSVPFPKQRDRKTEENKYAGVTIEYAEQVTTLSLIVLRRLRFPANGTPNPETDVAGRTVLAALGLCAATLAFENGMGLRSRCLLWPEGPMQWELLDKPGENPKAFTLTGDAAVSLFKAAVGKAKEAGLTWEETPIMLMPQPKLVDLVRLSQIEATKESSEKGD
jgi:CRISPR-associated protein Csb1